MAKAIAPRPAAAPGPMPPVTTLRLRNTHRLIPSKFSESGTVLSRLTEEDDEAAALLELDSATNDRLLGEEGLLPGISVYELVYGVDYAHIVNAAFTHASPEGGRFNGPDRGAWYAGLTRETSLAEVAFHKLRQLEEVGWPEPEVSTFDDYLADFSMAAHDLTGGLPELERYLEREPIPACYAEPQGLAERVLAEGGNGILYPSARLSRGTCVVCLRPPLVYHVRRGARLEMTLTAGERFSPRQAREIAGEDEAVAAKPF